MGSSVSAENVVAAKHVVGKRLRLSSEIGFDEWRVRNAPSATADEIGYITCEHVFEVSNLEGEWLQIKATLPCGRTLEGWARGITPDGKHSFVPAREHGSMAPSASSSSTPIITSVSRQQLRLSCEIGFSEWRIRNAPHLVADEVGYVTHEDILDVLQTKGEWLRVAASLAGGKTEGWVRGTTPDGKYAFVPHLDQDAIDNSNWAVLICGGTRGSMYGNPSRPWRDLGGEVPFLVTMGKVYAQMAEELGPERVIVIACLDTTRTWMRGMVERGYSEPANSDHREASQKFYGDAAKSKKKWAERLFWVEQECAALLARGGADYDGELVNPTTVLRVLAGDKTAGGRVIPQTGVGTLFLWVTTHGSAHSISIDVSRDCNGVFSPVPIVDEAVSETSSSLDANEWFWIMPHAATDHRPYQFVRLAGYSLDPTADPAANHPHLPLFVVYWQQIFSVLHAAHQRDPKRKVVTFYQFCLSGGHLSFLKRPAIRQHWGVDDWPIYMIASAGANQNSLGGTLTNIFIAHLRSVLDSGGTTSLRTFIHELEKEYWKQHRRLKQTNQHLPESMRMGEMQHYHTPNGGIQDIPVRAIFSNKLASERQVRNYHSHRNSTDELAGPLVTEARSHEAVQTTLVGLLVEMGFLEVDVAAALERTRGQPDLALELLLSGQ